MNLQLRVPGVTAEDLLQKISGGDTLAHIAARNGNLAKLVEAFLVQTGVSTANDFDETIRGLAARNGGLDVPKRAKGVKPYGEPKQRAAGRPRPGSIEECIYNLATMYSEGKFLRSFPGPRSPKEPRFSR